MNLATNYLGLKLKNPIMPGASPLVDHLDNVRRLEDAGAAAIVMHSLFEEQITSQQLAEFAHTENFDADIAAGWSLFGSYTYADVTVDEAGSIRRGPRAPRHTLTLGLDGRITDRIDEHDPARAERALHRRGCERRLRQRWPGSQGARTLPG